MTCSPSSRFRQTMQQLDLLAQTRAIRHQRNLQRMSALIEAADHPGDAEPHGLPQSGLSDQMLRAAVINDGRNGSTRSWPRAEWRRRAIERLAQSDRGRR